MSNAYHAPGGTGRDIAFQTIMDVPEPVGAALATFGMLGLMARLRRSRLSPHPFPRSAGIEG